METTRRKSEEEALEARRLIYLPYTNQVLAHLRSLSVDSAPPAPEEVQQHLYDAAYQVAHAIPRHTLFDLYEAAGLEANNSPAYTYESPGAGLQAIVMAELMLQARRVMRAWM